MNKAEAWIADRMTVRRWLVAVTVVGVLATTIGFLALRPSEADDALPATTAAGGAVAAGEQRPTKLAITSDVGSVGTLDGLATVTLSVYPLRVSDNWSVAVHAPTAPGSAARELNLPGPQVPGFIKAVDEAVRRHDPESDVTVADTTIHTVESAPGEYRYDVRCVGVLRLNNDLMADLKRTLEQAQAQRAWLMSRTGPLRSLAVPTLAAASADDPTPYPAAPVSHRVSK